MEDEQLSVEEAKERKIMKMLLKVKNGTPPQRKSALRQLTDKARDFGAGPLFNQILPLLMSPTLEDQERHLLVKVPPDPIALLVSSLLELSALPSLYSDLVYSWESRHHCNAELMLLKHSHLKGLLLFAKFRVLHKTCCHSSEYTGHFAVFPDMQLSRGFLT